MTCFSKSSAHFIEAPLNMLYSLLSFKKLTINVRAKHLTHTFHGGCHFKSCDLCTPAGRPLLSMVISCDYAFVYFFKVVFFENIFHDLTKHRYILLIESLTTRYYLKITHRLNPRNITNILARVTSHRRLEDSSCM